MMNRLDLLLLLAPPYSIFVPSHPPCPIWMMPMKVVVVPAAAPSHLRMKTKTRQPEPEE